MARKQWFALLVCAAVDYGEDVWLSVQDSPDPEVAIARVKAVAGGDICLRDVDYYVSATVASRDRVARVEYIGGHIE